ncbi:MAG TPA: UbiA family prenyltransferase [Clostridiales bacterium]|nr:UbiA family prenyltransferase [Clostridiales bacterium]HPV01802.1 UbiA family prenyltransferase [Clostridiales bacterium]
MIKRFLSYVEIKTKITSTFAFLLTIAYLLYMDRPIDWLRTMVFFFSMFLFDLTTTAINNYIDTKTNDQVLQFERRTALVIIYILFAASTALGLYLAYLTDIVVLLLGGLCFLTGVFYTYGPVPISRMPLGEVMSGLFYGLFIPFLLLYINMPEGTYLTLGIGWESISLELKVMPIISVILMAIPPMCTTANIMLANNTCDVERDVAVRRYTLPYYLGKKALWLFAFLYYASYASIVAMVILDILSPVCLVSLLTVIPVQRNISIFMERQDKATTFMTSIKNYIIIMGSLTVTVFISAVL